MSEASTDSAGTARGGRPQWLMLLLAAVLCVGAYFAWTLVGSEEVTNLAGGPEAAARSAAVARKAERSPAGTVAFHRPPKPLAPDAVTSDWTRFLGPTNDCKSPETPLLVDWPGGGPELVWEMPAGEGYATPAIQGERLVYFHRIGDEAVVECRNAETGEQFWESRYTTEYEDRFGYSGGPRCPPIIDGNRTYTYGPDGVLSCFHLETGDRIWQRHLLAEFKLEQNFFGVGDTPLVEGDLLIINLGAPKACVAALDKHTGEMMWGAGDEWTPGYSSPIASTVHGRRYVFVFAGGESRPPAGGLLAVDPAGGELRFQFPWRHPRKIQAVNASCPVVAGNRVFVSATYGTGGACLELKPDGDYEVAWTTRDLATHWMTSVHHEGYLYGIDGRHENEAQLVCLELATGKQMWRDPLEWDIGAVGRGSLLRADGRFLCLGEYGDLLWLDLSPQGCKILKRTSLFRAHHTWGMPVVSHGLLYVNQNLSSYAADPPRLLCYDLRGGADGE